jgi:hypothetical protein
MDWKAAFGLEQYSLPIGKDWRTWLFPGIVLIPFIFVTFFSSLSFDLSTLIVFAYIWLVYGVKKVPFAESDDPIHKEIRTAIIAAPVLAMAAFVTGKQKADSALTTMSDPYKLKMKGGEQRNRILLRSFDKGLLVRSPADERVEFIKWDQIEEVTKSSPRNRGESYSCQWFQISCSKEPLVP